MYAIVENNEIKQFVNGDNFKNISFGANATVKDRQDAGLYLVIDEKPELTIYQSLGNETYSIDNTAKTVTKKYEIIELDHKSIDDEIASKKRDEEMLKGLKYGNYQVSLTSQDGLALLQVKAAFDMGILETNIKFANGTIMPITSSTFADFAQWFVTERNKFFIEI